MYTEIAWRESIEARQAELRRAGRRKVARGSRRAPVSTALAVTFRRAADRFEVRAAAQTTCLEVPRSVR